MGKGGEDERVQRDTGRTDGGREAGRRRKAGLPLSLSLSRVVSLTSARLIIIINSNLGISPPEGTSRLYWQGRAHGGEANVVKAGCY